MQPVNYKVKHNRSAIMLILYPLTEYNSVVLSLVIFVSIYQ